MPSQTKIQPFILGKGRSGKAIEMSLALIRSVEPGLEIAPVTWLKRGQPLRDLPRPAGFKPVLFVANPHGLHARAILEGSEAGIPLIVCEKPACVSLEEAATLESVQTPVAVLHGYRMLWGPQTLRQWIREGDFGDLFAIEGRYWQSSSAERAIAQPPVFTSWKDDPQLSGPADALLDIGTHWVDLAFHLAGERPERSSGWLSYVNAQTRHRDTHAHLAFDFPRGARALVSVSKTVHGASNQFEVSVLGSRRAAHWSFLSPDEIIVGEGKDRMSIARKEPERGTGLAPFHAAGWLDGYTAVIRSALLGGEYPTLQESVATVRTLLEMRLIRA